MELRFGDGFAFASFSHGQVPAAAAATPPHWRFASHAALADEEDLLTQAAYRESLAHMRSAPRAAGDEEALRAAFLDSDPRFDPWQRGPAAAAASDAGGSTGAAERAAALSRLPVSRLESTEAGAGAGACAVCLEAMEGGQAVVRLPCLHLFHHDCIGPWVLRAGRCPVCKHPV
jgi:hypothetical protein